MKSVYCINFMLEQAFYFKKCGDAVFKVFHVFVDESKKCSLSNID